MSNVDILAVESMGMNWWKIHGTLNNVQLQQAGFKWDSYDTKIMDVQSLDALEQSGRREKTWENIRVIIGLHQQTQTNLERDFDHGVLQIIQSINLLSVDVGWEFNGLDFASVGWPEHLHQGWIMQKNTDLNVVGSKPLVIPWNLLVPLCYLLTHLSRPYRCRRK